MKKSGRISLQQTNRISQKQKQRRVLYASLSFAALFGIGLYFFQSFNSTTALAINTNAWTNGNGNGNWNTPGNWSQGRVPNSTDIATFDGSSSAACNINGAANVAGISISSAYAGTVTQATGASITIGSSGFVQSGGIFTGSGSNITITTGTFLLSNGTFNAPSGSLIFSGNYSSSATVFTHSGGSFNHNNGTVSVAPAVNNWNSITLTFDVSSTTSLYNLTVSAATCCNVVNVSTGSGDTVHVENNIVHADGAITGLFAFRGNLTVNSSSDGGSGWLVAEGGGAQTYTSTGNFRTCGLLINKSAGTLSAATGTTDFSVQRLAIRAGEFVAPSGNLRVGGNWNSNITLMEHSGGVFTANSGTTILDPNINGWSASVFTADVLASTQFYNLSVNAATCCSQNIIATASGDTLHVMNNLVHSDGMINGLIDFSGNLTVNTGSDGGSGMMIANSAADQYYTSAGANRTCGIVVNKSAGSLLPGGGTTTLSCQRLILNAGTFTAPSGTCYIGGNWNQNITIFQHNGGVFTNNAGTVSFDPAINGWSGSTFTVDVDATTQFENIILNGSTCCSQNILNCPAGDTLMVNAGLTHNDGYISSPIKFNGNLVVNAGADGGNGWFIAGGSAAQTYSSSSGYRTAGLKIDKDANGMSPAAGTTSLSVQRLMIAQGSFSAPSGVLYVGGNWNANVDIFKHSGGTFAHNSGTVSFDPAINGWSASVFTIDVLSSTLFNSIVINGSTCCSQNNIATAAGDTVHALSDVSHIDSYISGLFEFKGNLTVGTGADGGSGWLIADGIIKQSYSCLGTYRTCGLLISKPAGTMEAAAGTTILGVQRLQIDQGTFFAPSGNFNIGGNWNANVNLFSQSGGTFVPGSGTVHFDAYINGWSASSFNVEVLPSTEFYDVISNITSCCSQGILTTSSGDTIDVLHDFTHTDGYISGLISFKNNITVNSSADGGNGWVIAEGTTDQHYTCTSGYRTCGLLVNKSSGTLDAASGTTALGIQRFTLVNGTFNAPSGTLSIGGNWNANVNLYTQSGGNFVHNNGTVLFNPYINGWSASVFAMDVIPVTQFYNLTMNATSCCSQPVFSSAAGDTLHVLNNMLLTDGKNNALLGAEGNVTVSPAFDGGTGTLLFNGTVDQYFDCTGATALFDGNIMLNKASGKVVLSSSVSLDAPSQSMTFTRGILVSTSANLLNFGDNVTTSGAGYQSFVEGPVKKTGNDLFTFPIGKNDTIYAPLRISAPSVVTDAFIAEYFRGNPDPLYAATSKDASIINLSSCEYWGLSRLIGTSNVTVNLSFGNVRSCGVTVPAELVVARWDGTRWKNNGRSTITGTAANGTITSLGTASTYIAFTLGSSTSGNALPITLLSFDATWNDGVVDLEWSTAAEENNDYFTVERSPDLQEIVEVARQQGAGTTTTMQYYKASDQQPLPIIAYYRLRQTDFDGTTTTTEWKELMPGVSADKFEFTVYPNPSDGNLVHLNLPGNSTGDLEAEVYSVAGVLVAKKTIAVTKEQTIGDLDFPERLAAGNYILRLHFGDQSAALKMQVR